jgi:hypothetical protein
VATYEVTVRSFCFIAYHCELKFRQSGEIERESEREGMRKEKGRERMRKEKARERMRKEKERERE